MFSKWISIICFILFSPTFSTHAAELVFIPQDQPNLTPVQFFVKYALGTHKGYASRVHGQIVLNENYELLKSDLRLNLSEMSSNDNTRDCHMREAMGIEYAQSRFPGDHVCDSNDRIPTVGPDSVVYPQVMFKIEKIFGTENLKFQDHKPVMIKADVMVTMHGTSKVIPALPIRLTPRVYDNSLVGFRVLTTFNISLKEFNVMVKPAKIGPITRGVDDIVPVKIDFSFELGSVDSKFYKNPDEKTKLQFASYPQTKQGLPWLLHPLQ